MKNKKFTIGIVLIVIGVIGLFGLFSETEDKVSLAIGSVVFIGVGVVLFFLNKKDTAPTTGKGTTAEPSLAVKKAVSDESTPTVKKAVAAEPVKRSVPDGEKPTSNEISTNGGYYNDGTTRTERKNKGKSLISFPEDYTVIDLETTGFSPSSDNIIEISALRVRGGEIADSFSTLVKPYKAVDEVIMELTGITNDMLSTAPTPEDVLPSVRDFIGDDIVVGHNVNFDVNFLYDWFEIILNKPFSNDFIDTMQIAKKSLKLSHYRLQDVCDALGVVPDGAHRATVDCDTTYKCFCKLRDIAASETGTDASANNSKKYYHAKKFDARNITTDKTEFDETHPIFGKHCVFTGTLTRMQREEAAQAVVDLGGKCDNGITKKTNFLILGQADYQATGGGKSTKQKKAEEYILNGIDIEIISEDVFYDMLDVKELTKGGRA